MAFTLKEYYRENETENEWSKTIHEVEDFLREKDVQLTVISGDLVQVEIKGRLFEMRHPGICFPRFTEEEKLYLPTSD